MTDPRIEALIDAVQAEGLSFKHAIHGDDDQTIAARILAAADAAAWRPIETAPRDGTEILGFDGAHVVVSWVDNSWWSDVGATFPPTRWQPLHAPPEGEVQG